MKNNIVFFLTENFQFLEMKYIYFNRRVFVMNGDNLDVFSIFHKTMVC